MIRMARAAAKSTPTSVSRFAPSPTGYLHLGHAYSALMARAALGRGKRAKGGQFLVRLEDIDTGRCRSEFEDALFEDLEWLGLEWETPVRRQSEHMDDYAEAIRKLDRRGLLYPCFCTRSDIQAEIERSGAAPHGPEGRVYPGICRGMPDEKAEDRIDAGEPYALRLDMQRACTIAGPLVWDDASHGQVKAKPEAFGDIVIARKDTPTSYHLAATVDDALQGVTHVVRGADLFDATHIHRLLQELLGLPTPQYHHHRLITDEAGKRIAKRNGDYTIRALREAQYTPDEVIAMTGYEGQLA